MNSIRINLLPYREQRKARQRQILIATFSVVLAAAVAIVGSGHIILTGMNDNQIARNQLLKDEIAKLDKQIEEIKQYTAKTDTLLKRQKVVEDLQNNRSELVHLFDQMARLLPEGVYLTSLKQEGEVLTLQGMAQSSARVSAFMHNLETSPRFATPTLIEVRAATKDNYRASQFSMTVKQKQPETVPQDASNAEAKP